MTEKKYVIALDQGTTSSRAILFDRKLRQVGVSQTELTQIYPDDGWVEHDPMEIYSTIYSALIDVITRYGVSPQEISSIGITNQRETTVVWDRHTGKPVYNAIVWQCRRTSPLCEKIKGTGLEEYIRSRTGLVIDAYFSAAKIKWILDNVPSARERAENGDLLFGTVDCWLIWKLTGGAVHATDRTNASRTMLYNIAEQCWDERLFEEFKVPESMLPEVKSSGDDFGSVNISGTEIPICSACGDQQAALFGQGCYSRGDVKNTYGTGCFMLVNTGDEMIISPNGLVTTVTAGLNGESGYAVEGSIFTGGAVIQWLRDEMKLISSAAQSQTEALSVPDNGGVHFVPAFTGLGTPYWDMYARGTITGLTRASRPAHIIRAALESIAFQTNDVLDTMRQDLHLDFGELRVDGGACANDFLMQFQSDISRVDIIRPSVRESTALGAAALAGLQSGFFTRQEEIPGLTGTERQFTPSIERKCAEMKISAWHDSVRRSLSR